MGSNKSLQVFLVSLLLMVGPLLAIISYPVTAESTEGTTTLYFHYPTSGEDSEGLVDIGFAPTFPMNKIKPTTKNDSAWPPRLIDGEAWVTWFTLWALSQSSEGSLIEDFGELADIVPLESLQDALNPFRIRGKYTYNGEDTVDIKGDLVFDLYFSSTFRSKLTKDDVQVSIAHPFSLMGESFDDILPVDIEIMNATETLKPKIIGGRVQEYKITVQMGDTSYPLKPGDSLIFAIKIIPSEKYIGKILTALESRGVDIWTMAKKLGDFLSKIPITAISDLGTTLQEIVNFTEEMEINITLSDLASLSDGTFLTTNFIFDAIEHPSSVTLPVKLVGEEEDIRIYYLHNENIMDENRPTDEKPVQTTLSDQIITWDGPVLDRSKILKVKDVTADLYINYRSLLKGKISLTATLYDGDTVIDASQVELERDILLTKPTDPTTFTFQDIDYELSYGKNLKIGISFSNGTKPGLLEKAILFYNADKYASSLTVKYEETTHIQINDADELSTEKLIVPGGSVDYLLNITSVYSEDNILVSVLGFSDDEQSTWDVEVIPDTLAIPEGGSSIAHVFVNSTDRTKEAYDSAISLVLFVAGKTGAVRLPLSVMISEDARIYDVDIVSYTEHTNIKKGENATLSILIKNNNTAAEDENDNYLFTATSQNNWQVDVEHEGSLENIPTNTEVMINLTVFVPRNASLESDVITFTITSGSDSNAFAVVDIPITVTGLNVFEMLYDFFESVATSLGFDTIFGADVAPWVLISIFAIIILFMIVVIALLLTKKFVTIVCVDRIREIDPTDTATYEITLCNNSKRARSYEVSVAASPADSWNVAGDTTVVTIEPGQSKLSTITVTPTSLVKPHDWTQVTVTVKTVGRRTVEKITLMTSIKDGTADLLITGVTTWPRQFKHGDIVTTTCRLENQGTVAAQHVTVRLLINGEEKNKVVDVTIPSRGYAHIRLPWIAVEGKNDIHITAHEEQQ